MSVTEQSPPIVELTPIQDVFADRGICRVERLGGGCVRLSFGASHKDHNGRDETVIVASVVALKWSIFDSIKMLTDLCSDWHWTPNVVAARDGKLS